MNHDEHELAKHAIDALSIVTVIGALIDMLPSIAALFTIVWTGIRIYETDTAKKVLGKFRRNDESAGS